MAPSPSQILAHFCAKEQIKRGITLDQVKADGGGMKIAQAVADLLDERAPEQDQITDPDEAYAAVAQVVSDAFDRVYPESVKATAD